MPLDNEETGTDVTEPIDYFNDEAIAEKLGAEAAAEAPAASTTPSKQEPAKAAPPAPPAPAKPTTPPAPAKFKVKVDGEEIEMSRADLAKRFEELLAGDQEDLTKVASFTGYLNKKSQALSKDRDAWESKKSAERQQLAEDFLIEYTKAQHGDRAPEVVRQINALLNGTNGSQTTAQAAPNPTTNNAPKLPEGVDPNDPLAVAYAQTATKLSNLEALTEKVTRQIEEMAKASHDAKLSHYQAQVRAEFEGAIKAHPILQDDLFADVAKAKVYALVKDGGLDMSGAASRVAKELEERDSARIAKYVESKKEAAKAAAAQPPSAAPALAKKKTFSFSGDADENEAMIAEKLGLE